MLMLYGLSCITNMIFSARDLIFWILAHIIYALRLVKKFGAFSTLWVLRRPPRNYHVQIAKGATTHVLHSIEMLVKLKVKTDEDRIQCFEKKRCSKRLF